MGGGEWNLGSTGVRKCNEISSLVSQVYCQRLKYRLDKEKGKGVSFLSLMGCNAPRQKMQFVNLLYIDINFAYNFNFGKVVVRPYKRS